MYVEILKLTKIMKKSNFLEYLRYVIYSRAWRISFEEKPLPSNGNLSFSVYLIQIALT